MDAVQRDLNNILTPEQIDFGGLHIYTTLDPTVQSAAEKALESHLAKVESQPGFRHPPKAQYRAPAEGEDSSMPYLQGRCGRDRQRQRRNSRTGWRSRFRRQQIQSRALTRESPDRLFV
jgi:membrane carboxypeptidase/penicillin-binding protein